LLIEIKGYKLHIETCEGVYPPSEDTFLLAETLSENDIKEKNVLEIGTGTGFIAILCAKMNAKTVTATDIKPKSIQCAKRNAELNKVKITILHGDLFEPVKGKTYDTIIFNPPYLPQDPIHDKYLTEDDKLDLIGGEKGIETTIRFLKNLKKHLKNNGKAYIVTSTLSHINEIIKTAKNEKLYIKKESSVKYENEEIIVFKIQQKYNTQI